MEKTPWKKPNPEPYHYCSRCGVKLARQTYSTYPCEDCVESGEVL